MVAFGSEQGMSDFETDGVAVTAIAGIAGYVEDFKRVKTPLRAKRCRLWMDTKEPYPICKGGVKMTQMSGFVRMRSPPSL